MNKPGILIVLEGADGAGKATQTCLLVERLKKEGKRVETMDFPQYKNNVIGKLIGECLEGHRGDYMNQDAQVVSVLFAADRFESKGKLTQWLSEGAIVILDRYASSNMIHQGARTSDAKELDTLLAWIDNLEFNVFGSPRPDKVIYLNVPASERRKLSQSAGKNDLAERHVAHQVAADETGKLAAKRFSWSTIDCIEAGELRSIEDIGEEVYNQVQEALKN